VGSSIWPTTALLLLLLIVPKCKDHQSLPAHASIRNADHTSNNVESRHKQCFLDCIDFQASVVTQPVGIAEKLESLALNTSLNA